ncbi:hypothetical protein Tco_1233750 [Tanacetum coccineum]
MQKSQRVQRSQRSQKTAESAENSKKIDQCYSECSRKQERRQMKLCETTTNALKTYVVAIVITGENIGPKPKPGLEIRSNKNDAEFML